MREQPLDLMGKNLQLVKIRELLSKQPRNRLLLEMMLQTTAPVQSLLALKASDLKDLKQGALLPIKSETEDTPYIFSATIKKYFDLFYEKHTPGNPDFIFRSNKGRKALSKTSVSRLVRKWIKDSGINCAGLRGLRALTQAQAKEMSAEQPGKTDASQKGYTPPKINTMTRQEAVFQELEKAIITGNLRPGQKLSTEGIARSRGVSRIPVREAMARLAERGFITTQPKKGSVVNELSRDNLKEILDLRLMLECEAVAKAALNITDSTIAELVKTNAAFTRARRQNRADELLDANRKFHLLAYRDSNAPILIDIINHLWDKVSPYYNIMFRQSVTTHPRHGVNFHDHLIKALRCRNAEEATSWLKTDLIHSAEFVLELFDLHQAGQSKSKDPLNRFI